MTNRSVYLVIGVDLAGDKNVLGLWVGTGGEGAKFWMRVLTTCSTGGCGTRCSWAAMA